MLQPNRRPSTSRHIRHLPVIVGGILIILCIIIAGVLLVIHARTNSTSSAQPTPTSPVTIPVAVTTTAVARSTQSVQPTKLIPVTVSAYTLEGAMADGKQTHVGACAVSTAQFPLGTILYLYNPDGSFNRQCIAEDTGGSVQVGQIDIAMPGDTAGAVRWGVRHLLARIVRWGWGNGGSPTPLPTP